MWIKIDEFASNRNVSLQAVYKRVKKGTLKSRKDKNGKLLVYITEKTNEKQKSETTNTDVDKVISELKKAHAKEIEALKEVIEMKDNQIEELKKRNNELERENKKLKEKKGLLDFLSR